MKTIFLLFVISIFGFYNQSYYTWHTITTTNEPTKRHECGVTSVNGKIYLLGGRGIKKVYSFNVKSKTWESLAETPIEMHHIQPVVFKNDIYITAGFTGSYPLETPLSHVYKFNTVTNEWTKLLEIPESRRRGAAGVAILNDKIYIANGITLGHTSGTNKMFDVFDTSKNTWDSLTNVPHIRDHCAATINRNKLYIVGGRNTSYHEEDNFLAFFGKTEDAIDVYDFDKTKWETLTQKLPVPTAGGGLISYKNLIIYSGGESKQNLAHNETQSYNVRTQNWKLLSNLQTGRHGTNATLIGNKIYIAAGCSSRGGNPEISSIEYFEIK